MARNDDGTTDCDRCGEPMLGYGVTNGLIVSALVDDQLVELIFCYWNACDTHALADMINFPDAGRVRCATCNRLVSGVIDAAMCSVARDDLRLLSFCREAGHDQQLLDQGRATE